MNACQQFQATFNSFVYNDTKSRQRKIRGVQSDWLPIKPNFQFYAAT